MAAVAAASANTTTAAMTEYLSAHPRPRRRPRGAAGPDRLTVLLVSLAGFFATLAVLANQMRVSSPVHAARPMVVVRRVYETRVVEKVPANVRATGGVSSSVTPVSTSVPAAPVTRSS